MYLKTPARRQQKQYERKEKNLKKKLKQHNTYIFTNCKTTNGRNSKFDFKCQKINRHTK